MLKLLLILAALALLAYAGLIAMVCYKEANVPEAGDYDAIIVLGAQVLPDGTPNVQLEWRLEAALKAWQEKSALIVTCGAQGVDEPRPEADVMRDWLIERGVPADQIFAENTSFNTRENIDNAMALIKDHAVSRVVVVTSDYHLPRALALCEDAGVNAGGIGSPCKPEYWFKNHGREALAWVKYWGEKYLGLSVPNINQWLLTVKSWFKP
ncbi:MAG: YdcF family protein [Clostridia bacterium]|nr:YdcF family protein [Clostridia bacterium]